MLRGLSERTLAVLVYGLSAVVCGLVEAGDQPYVPLDDRHLRAESPVELGELAAGDASADHHQAGRHLVRGGRVARVPDLGAFELRRRDRG
jgi:hypothetical protein